MEKKEYFNRLQLLEKEHSLKVQKLKRQFAEDNRKYSVGDILQDHYQIIEVSKITFGTVFGSDISECIYYGKELTKKLKPKKSGNNGRMPESSVLKKLK